MAHEQLTPDIIHDLIIEPLAALDICLKHQLSVDQLHALVTSDQFKQLADQLTDIDHARAPFTRARMLDILARIAALEPESPTQTETIRKAAAQILRVTNAPPQDPNDNTPDTPDDPTDTPPPPSNTTDSPNPSGSTPEDGQPSDTKHRPSGASPAPGGGGAEQHEAQGVFLPALVGQASCLSLHASSP